jgi:hypothetical protein
VLLVILAVLGVALFMSGGADRVERHLRDRAAARGAGENVTPIRRDLDSAMNRHPSGQG